LRQHGAGEQPKAADIHVEGFVPLLLCYLFDGSDMKDSSIVDEDIDPAKMNHRLLDHAVNVKILRYVPDANQSGVANLACDGFEAISATTDKNDFGAFACQCHSASLPDATTCTSDDGDPVFKAEFHALK
jgi:hypothetical protein